MFVFMLLLLLSRFSCVRLCATPWTTTLLLVPLQSSCLENPTDRGAWWTTVHGVPKSRTRLNWYFHFQVFVFIWEEWDPQLHSSFKMVLVGYSGVPWESIWSLGWIFLSLQKKKGHREFDRNWPCLFNSLTETKQTQEERERYVCNWKCFFSGNDLVQEHHSHPINCWLGANCL